MFPALLLTLIVDIACPDVAIVVSGSHFWAERLRKMQRQRSRAVIHQYKQNSGEAEKQKRKKQRNQETEIREAKQQPKRNQQKGLINEKNKNIWLSSNRLDPLTETF